MLAVDVLEVPMSGHRNRYLLVLQDYRIVGNFRGGLIFVVFVVF